MIKKTLVGLILGSAVLMGGCSEDVSKELKDVGGQVKKDIIKTSKDELGKKLNEFTNNEENTDVKSNVEVESLQSFKIPKYQGSDVVAINRNEPFFTKKELKDLTPYERFSSLDRYGRAKTAEAVVDKSMMPTSKRTSLTYNPVGFENQIKVLTKRGKEGYLYDRCHLIGHQLTGENNTKENLTTCTRTANRINMVLYENEIASYVKNGGVVKMRVTPMYDHNDLVAKGILFEAKSLDSDKISYNVFLHNVQSGVSIDYKTGKAQIVENK